MDRFVEVGGNIERLEPTPKLKFVNGVLHQWFEARTKISGSYECYATKGEWHPVPSE